MTTDAAMRNRRNYYRILHIQPDAAPAIVRSSYRALMLQLEMHPDHGGDHWNAALINEAYAILSDPRKREEYDQELLKAGGRKGLERGSSSPFVAPWKAPTRNESPAAVPDAGSRCVFCHNDCKTDPLQDPSLCCAVCRSPLYPASRLELGASGNRAASRMIQRRAVRFFVEWPQQPPFHGQLEDVSPRGLCLATRTRLDEYQIVKIDAGSLQAVGRVAQIRSGRDVAGEPTQYGIEFCTVLLQPGFFVTRHA